MKNFVVNHVLPCVIGVSCGLLFTVVLTALERSGKCRGEQSARAAFQKESVAAGHAEYVVDEDGSPKWQWKALSQESK